MSAPGFWDEGGDPAVLRERSNLQERLSDGERLEAALQDADAMP